MDLAEIQQQISHDPRGYGWGRRGDLRVAWYPDGKTDACRWCAGPLPPRRRSWCGTRCVGAYTLRSHFATLRRYVMKRDRHRCQICEQRGHEVDHALACTDGGTDDPANLRLLCVPCHKGLTLALCRRLTAERRACRPQLELA